MPDDQPYHTAYKEGKGQICPETGRDLSEYSADGVRAHAEDLFPHIARDNFSPEAKARKAILLEIAKEKEG